ncbi:MAG: hypothetical protein WB697_08205, partial [Stellaceae bacterium]
IWVTLAEAAFFPNAEARDRRYDQEGCQREHDKKTNAGSASLRQDLSALELAGPQTNLRHQEQRCPKGMMGGRAGETSGRKRQPGCTPKSRINTPSRFPG